MINVPTIFIIFGATGDLVSKKIVPSLYHLFGKKLLPDKFCIIGVSNDKQSDEEFRNLVYADLLKHQGVNINTCGEFCQIFQYHEGNFKNNKTYKKLDKKINSIEEIWGVCTNKLYFLATPPSSYIEILRQLSESGLTKHCGGIEGWSRVLIEKPFGNDLKSAKELNKITSSLLKEEQIYHIDHYLGKEMMRNILAFRFANDLFAPGWNSKYISEINIRLHEVEGVEKRGKFYDSIGALSDVGQNHMLEMIALICMKNPTNKNPESIRKARLSVIQGIKIPTKTDVIKDTYRAQYIGYKNIEGVDPKSSKETFFSIKTSLNNSNWNNVKVTIESGKKLADRKKEIEVIFNHPKNCLCDKKSEVHNPSRIVFSIEPEEDIGLYFLAKKPGFKDEVEPHEMHFNMRDIKLSEKYVEEYEKLILDAISGDQTLFVSSEEIESSWKFIDAIKKVWGESKSEIEIYPEYTDKPIIAAKTKFEILDKKTTPVLKEIKIIGLGKMGGNIAKRLVSMGWNVEGYDPYISEDSKLKIEGIKIKNTLEELFQNSNNQTIVWIMIPAGKKLDNLIFDKNGISKYLKKGDIIIDGGNSYYEDSIKRSKKLEQENGIHYIDVGVSGGPLGAIDGACLMCGGDKNIIGKIEYLFDDLATRGGYQYVGASGAGHYAKMVHNGIEYGMMQSIAEGFEILRNSKYKYNLAEIAELYNNGSVISSRLIEWLSSAYKNDGNDLKNIDGVVAHTGEAEWTVKVAKETKIKTPVINSAISVRKLSKMDSYQGKILSALREQFGGHSVRIKKGK